MEKIPTSILRRGLVDLGTLVPPREAWVSEMTGPGGDARPFFTHEQCLKIAAELERSDAARLEHDATRDSWTIRDLDDTDNDDVGHPVLIDGVKHYPIGHGSGWSWGFEALPSDEEIHAFCAEHLAGQTVGEFTAYWSYPGFLNLSSPETDAHLVATPATSSGEPSTLTFTIDCESIYLVLSDEEGFSWNPETAVARWRAAVEKRLPAFREAVAVLRAEGLEGFARFCDEAEASGRF